MKKRLPTPAEIEARTEEIRKHWSATKQQSRKVYRPAPVTAPWIEPSGGHVIRKQIEKSNYYQE